MQRLLIICIITFAITSYGQIDTIENPVINGLRQSLKIKSAARNKPILLFLHGGPGNPMSPYADKFCVRLYDHFTVVHWDQRESGKTLLLNASGRRLQFEDFQIDTEQVVDYLLKRFSQPKLYLVGHSWGTALGFQLVKKHPDWVYAFVAVGSMIHQFESERQTLRDILSKENNNALLADSIRIPFESWRDLYRHRKAILSFNGSRSTLSASHVRQWSTVWLTVFNEASGINLLEDLPVVQCPVYFFHSRSDYQTNWKLVERYHQQVRAPHKEIYWFDKSAHAIPTSEPRKFQELIIGLTAKHPAL